MNVGTSIKPPLNKLPKARVMKLHEKVTDLRIIKRYESIEKELSDKHNNKYDYKNSIFNGSSKKIDILCKYHGTVFKALVWQHLKGSGCPICATEKSAETIRFSTKDFITKAKSIHGDIYDYSKVEYVQNRQAIIIVCKVHGEFLQVPHTHTLGSGCTKCRNERLSDTSEQFIEKAVKIHGELYDYSKVIYKNNLTKVIIGCKKCGDFEQTPGNHLAGKHCRKCRSHGFDVDKPAILYYVKVIRDTQTFYKIGITNKTISERFGRDMQYITVLQSYSYKTGKDAYNEEQKMLLKYKHLRYKQQDILISGNTEMFTKDIGYNQADMETLPNNCSADVIQEALTKLKD